MPNLPSQPPPGRPAVPIADILDAAGVLHAELERAVCRLRMSGATWEAVARALGVSRQAASKRWGYLDAPVAVRRADDGAVVFVHSLVPDVVLERQDMGGRGLAAAAGAVRALGGRS